MISFVCLFAMPTQHVVVATVVMSLTNVRVRVQASELTVALV